MCRRMLRGVVRPQKNFARLRKEVAFPAMRQRVGVFGAWFLCCVFVAIPGDLFPSRSKILAE